MGISPDSANLRRRALLCTRFSACAGSYLDVAETRSACSLLAHDQVLLL